MRNAHARAERLYIAHLALGQWSDNVYLSAADTPEQQVAFDECLRQVDELQKTSTDPFVFRSEVLKLFSNHGFKPIRK
jgi:hypothetical protein